MYRQVLTMLCAVFVIFTNACSTETTRTNGKYVVTGNADGAPSGCSPDEIASRISEVFEAIGKADPKVVDEYFGRADFAPFGWYSIGDDQHNFTAYQWNALDEYFQQRYQQHEQLELQSIQFNGWEQERGIVHFGPIVVVRRADDLGNSEHLYRGKGAYHCEARTIVVLSMAEAP